MGVMDATAAAAGPVCFHPTPPPDTHPCIYPSTHLTWIMSTQNQTPTPPLKDESRVISAHQPIHPFEHRHVTCLGVQLVGQGEVAGLLRDERPGAPEEGEAGADAALVQVLRWIGAEGRGGGGVRAHGAQTRPTIRRRGRQRPSHTHVYSCRHRLVLLLETHAHTHTR